MNRKSLHIALVTVAALALFACQDKKETPEVAAPAESVVTVVVDTLKATAFDEWVSYPAELRGAEDVTLTAGPGGRALAVAEVGTRVEAGTALCDIESARYAALLEQVQASIVLAKGELDRAEANVKAGSVGKASLDKAKLDYQGALVNEFQAKRALEDARCIAPFGGVVVSRSIEPFQTVNPGYPTLRIARTDRLEALISLPESDIGTYGKGSEVRFQVPGVKAEEYKGFLKNVDLAVDTRTRTAQARLIVLNRRNQLSPGMAGKALLLRKSYKAAIVIPTTAILRNEQGAFAMVAQNGVAQKRELKLGPSVSDSVVVYSGLQVGDLLITVGSFRASEGTKLKY